MENGKQEAREIALEKLRKAVTAAGGPSKVARRIRTPVSHLGNILSGKRGLGTEVAGRLRGAIKVPPGVLLELLAPAVLPLPAATSDDVAAQL